MIELANLRGTGVLGAVPVTAEQFGDMRSVGCPETTLLSVTDNAHTDNDTRRSVCVALHHKGALGAVLHRRQTQGPLRGHARSHRDCTVPVGAGLPAKRPLRSDQTVSTRSR
ncbi:protein of unknown function [Pseudomonas inefficax]|uniref:Uncharacterized protein n=1 Tax=Pseudomonas inefficax TaxID=2078786 RepID=A0AAQ1SRT3_9PSED|nr:protein of unknown function [Pseudomonas inefficax]